MIAELHAVLQIAFGWTDANLHRFVIHGTEDGIAYPGGIGFLDDAREIRLSRSPSQPGQRQLVQGRGAGRGSDTTSGAAGGWEIKVRWVRLREVHWVEAAGE
jgi:Plasmid pRiA4b ORF-3-like protein